MTPLFADEAARADVLVMNKPLKPAPLRARPTRYSAMREAAEHPRAPARSASGQSRRFARRSLMSSGRQVQESEARRLACLRRPGPIPDAVSPARDHQRNAAENRQRCNAKAERDGLCE